MKVIGVDSCKAGWFAVIWQSDKPYKLGIFEDINKLWCKHDDADIIVIDIPIGLVTNSEIERECDKTARTVLGPGRASSVFVSPSREAVYQYSYEIACEQNIVSTGRSLSKQTWAIIPKIREVDSFLTNNQKAREIIKESHPEIGFWALNNKCALKYNKKTSEGISERLDILGRYSKEAAERIFEKSLYNFKRSDLAKDDILDAFCLMVNGTLGEKYRFGTLPVEPKNDSTGLPMQMVYFDR